MSKHLAQVKVKRAERHRTPRATDHVYQPGDQVLVWMEKQINNRIGTYRGPFTVLSFDANSKIVLIEEEPGKAPKRYNTAQVKPYIEDPEEIAVNFMSSLNKAIANYRDVDDGGAHHSSTTHTSESTAGTSKCSGDHPQTIDHPPPNANNVIELEGPLHESIRTHLTEIIQAGTRARKIRE